MKVLSDIRGATNLTVSDQPTDRPPIYILTNSTKKAILSIKKLVKTCLILTFVHKFKSEQYFAKKTEKNPVSRLFIIYYIVKWLFVFLLYIVYKGVCVYKFFTVGYSFA